MKFKERYKRWNKMNKTFFRIAIVSLILTIIISVLILIWGPQVHNLLFGYVDINYNSNNIVTINGTNYAQIEVLNELGDALKYINGTITLNCLDNHFIQRSETFKLEQNREFLPQGQSELLFSPDPLLINLAETKNYECSDAEFKLANYQKINDSYSRLINVSNYKFFYNKDNLTIKETKLNLSEDINSRICIVCNLTISIYASGGKHFIKNETSKFVSGTTTVLAFPSIHSVPEGHSPNFAISEFTHLGSFPLCNNITNAPCSVPICILLKERYTDFDLDCTSGEGFVFGSSNPFNIRTFSF